MCWASSDLIPRSRAIEPVLIPHGHGGIRRLHFTLNSSDFRFAFDDVDVEGT